MKVPSKLGFLGKLCIGLLLSLVVSADEPTTIKSGHVPIPNPPKAKRDFSKDSQCVEPIDFIRRNHGPLLKHYRHDTMHHGVRDARYSIVECINCHVTPDTTGNYPNIKKNSEHFCRNCHTYAAVTIDCFQCHASVPAESTE